MARPHTPTDPEAAADLLGGILRRRQAITDQAERLRSDPQWHPPCTTCLREGKGLVMVEVECDGTRLRRLMPCPRCTEQCLWGVHRQEYARAAARRKREAWLRRAGIGIHYWHVRPERMREGGSVGRYLARLRENLAEGRGLILSGPVGVGKTATLALIALHAYDQGIESVRYVTVGRLMSALCHSRGAQEDWGEPWRSCRLLLLDELGAAYESDFAMAQLEELLGWRYDHRLATCVATNLTRGMLQTAPQYARLLDRWRETNSMLTLTGPSQRRADAPETTEQEGTQP